MNNRECLRTELIAYQLVDNPPAIRPASPRRSWMTATDQQHAYLCLPLVAANVYGWELICPVSMTASWDGGPQQEAVRVDVAEPHAFVPFSHFGHGILTFATGYIFRTSSGHNLWVKGPTNEFKDGLAPLEGLIETDWLPYGFTMNYQFTRPNQTVRFEAGEPFCLIYPVPAGYLADIEPTVRRLSADPELELEYRTWAITRRKWNAERSIEGSEGFRDQWRRDYLRGQTATGEKALEHKGAVKLKPFQDRRK